MSLESSDKYKATLKEVRGMPQNTREEARAKKERAREFRMEIMLDNARLIENATTQLEWTPWATEKDLQDSANQLTKYLAHPEVAETFIKDLKDTQRRIEKDMEIFIVANASSEERARTIYNLLTSSPVDNVYRELHGKVELDTSYPLALILFVEDRRDFALIDEKKNIGGFYKPEFRESLHFPIIAINGALPKDRGEPRTWYIEQHEKGHAEHERIQSALKTADRKTIWFTEPPSPVDVLALLRSEVFDIEVQSGRTENLEKSPAWSKVINYALERAKDELLAEFKAVGQVQNHLHRLQQKGGVYDYFLGLGISKDSILYNVLWEKYLKILEDAVKIVYRIMSPYKKLDLTVRLERMRWVFAQVPLRDFEKQFSGSAFIEEADLLTKIINEYALPSAYRSKGSTAERYNVLVAKLTANQGYSFLAEIRKYFTDTEK